MKFKVEKKATYQLRDLAGTLIEERCICRVYHRKWFFGLFGRKRYVSVAPFDMDICLMDALICHADKRFCVHLDAGKVFCSHFDKLSDAILVADAMNNEKHRFYIGANLQ